MVLILAVYFADVSCACVCRIAVSRSDISRAGVYRGLVLSVAVSLVTFFRVDSLRCRLYSSFVPFYLLTFSDLFSSEFIYFMVLECL